MQIFVPKEKAAEERRAPMVPETVKKLTSLGAGLVVEKGIGAAIHRSDAEYEAAGAQVIDDRVRGLREADMVLRLRNPPAEETSLLREGAIHVSYLDPFNELELIERLAVARVSAVSMEMIPRTTIAQKMDALSSQANLYSRDAACRVAWRADRPRSLPSLRTKRAARPAAFRPRRSLSATASGSGVCAASPTGPTSSSAGRFRQLTHRWSVIGCVFYAARTGSGGDKMSTWTGRRPKLNPEQVDELAQVKAARSRLPSDRELARKFDVDAATVTRYLRGLPKRYADKPG